MLPSAASGNGHPGCHGRASLSKIVTEVIARRAEVTTAFWVVPSNIGDHVEKTVPWGVQRLTMLRSRASSKVLAVSKSLRYHASLKHSAAGYHAAEYSRLAKHTVIMHFAHAWDKKSF